MATQVMNEPDVHPALLFMPDISGFTEFVSQTEILHAQSIIQEVLEVIIESNQLGFAVGEIEGDAVFFYRFGKTPAADQLLEQVKTMFTRFHRHLQLFDHERICPCGACTAAKDLTLKIIAHYGEVASYQVKEHHKLFGKDVIVIHRLLKNNLHKKEYALLTDHVFDDANALHDYPLWCTAEQHAESYDVGDINFKVIDLTPLHDKLPPIEELAIGLSQKARTAFSVEKVIDAPIDKVFLPIFDLPQRANWMEGVRAIEMVSKNAINRVGTLHRCITNRNNPVIVTEKASITETEIELVEMNQKGMGGCRYHLQKVDTRQTNLRIDILVKNSPMVSLLFNLLLRKKMKAKIEQSIDNLQKLCSG